MMRVKKIPVSRISCYDGLFTTRFLHILQVLFTGLLNFRCDRCVCRQLMVEERPVARKLYRRKLDPRRWISDGLDRLSVKLSGVRFLTGGLDWLHIGNNLSHVWDETAKLA